MDKLEQYLDQVCRSIGGPKSLRQHVRQELREHLLDAVAEHKAAGMTEEKALERALADFGGPEQVRSELEATHGHRLMPVVIDKAALFMMLTKPSLAIDFSFSGVPFLTSIRISIRVGSAIQGRTAVTLPQLIPP